MSNRSRDLIRRWTPRVLSTLQQGSTVSLRSHVNQPNIFIKSKWRDDGAISMVQRLQEEDSRICLKVSRLPDLSTSMGRDESHVLVELSHDVLNRPEDGQQVGDPLQPSTIDGITYPPDFESHEDVYSAHDDPIVSSGTSIDVSSGITMTLELPEKINIDCDLRQGGSVTVQNKIEGDVRIKTTDGNITLQKLRGHSIELKAYGVGNTIYSSDLLEAKTLSVSVPSSGRLRAKRIHSSTCEVVMDVVDGDSMSDDGDKRFDVDDGGAICDISSLYITGDASINVRYSEKDRQAVRVKSNHGHVTVHASAPLPTRLNRITNEPLPVVDMGGVNGSCEVFVDTSVSSTSVNDCTSCQVHFDSMGADSVSIVKSNVGTIHVTMDRKVESDIRMLSCTGLQWVDIDSLLLDDDDEDFESLCIMLETVDAGSELSVIDPIQVNTKAFSAKEGDRFPKLKNARFLDGWVENKSAEPDSRFDRKLRGETGSVGKIRLDGASNQALHHFQSDDKSRSGSDFVRPIVAIVGSGNIVLETLSWLGNIARRYGLEERRDSDDLGRTATRRGRSLKGDEQVF